MRITLLTITLILLPVQVYCKDLQQEYAVFSVGGENCQKYIEARKRGSASFKIYEEWLQGYLSAFNQFASNTYNILGVRTFSQIRDWLDKYCKKHPDQLFISATAILVSKLYPSRMNMSPARSEQRKVSIKNLRKKQAVNP